MTNLMILVAIVVVFLVILGAANRKKLKNLIKSEAEDFIDKNLDQVKVAKSKIKSIKEEMSDLIDKAAELHALVESQNKQLVKLETRKNSELNLAKKAKEEDNRPLALTKLNTVKVIEGQIKLCEENIQTAESQRTSIENKLERMKSKIDSFELQLVGLEARQKTNKILSKTVSTVYDSDGIENMIDSCENKISGEEIKLEYKMSFSEDDDDETTPGELEEEYNNL